MKNINLQSSLRWRFTQLLLLLVLTSFHFSQAKAQIIINEILPGGTVELKNIGNNAVNVNNYWLCDFPAYQNLGNSTLECGSLPMMMPGEIITVNDFNFVSETDGEMGLYSSNSFGSSAAIVDYVEWGSTGHQRSSVAVAAGIWSTGAFVPAFAAEQSLAYDGDGNAVSDWTSGNATICAENSTNCTAESGIILTNDDTVICVDGNPDPINVTVTGSQSGTFDGWIITDIDGTILGLPQASPFDLDGAGVGTCVIYYIKNEADLTGKTVGNNISDLAGCFDLSNGINVYRQAPDGGTVTSNGQTTLNFTAGNVVFDVQHTTVADMLSYWYIITDENDNILAWHNAANGPTLDASGAPNGTCHVWGWSYKGLGDPVAGNHISTLNDDDCEAISSNWITVIRNPAGCTVDAGSIATPMGDTEVTICVDGNPDPINVNVTGGTAGAESGWIITDIDGTILGLPMAPPFDLDGAGVGTCIIYYITNEADLIGKEAGNNISDLAGCFDLSNGITIYRQAPDGGEVSLTNGDTSYSNCAGDIVLDVQNTSVADMLSYWYIITDENDNILAWLNSADGNTIDASGAPAGTCHIWGWSYRGLDDPIVGDHISTLDDDDCEDISSNWITVYREIPDGGMVSSNGETTLNFTAGNVIFDVQHTTTATNLSYWYIITDENDNILAWHNAANGPTLDASGAPAGTCHVWGWNYKGLGDPVVGDHISTLSDDFCEDISDNWITVIRNPAGCTVDAGSIATPMGDTEVTICVDGNPDPINVNVTGGTAGAESGWIITDIDGTILGLPMAPPFDLDGAGVGTCIIYYITNEADLIGKEAGNNISDLAGCFDLSNGITIYRQAPDGGEVSLTNGDTSYSNCAGDIVLDVQNTSVADMLSYWYIITDENDNILAWLNSADGNTIDASGAPAGTCHIWGWSYRGLDDPIVGDHISTLDDDDCEDISSNWITVYREIPDGGMVSLTNGDTTFEGCAGDIVIDVQHTTTAPNLSYWYIITDDLDNILALHNTADGNTLDLSGAPAGVCHIWGWNYKGLNDPIMGNHISTLNNDFCEAISDNWITVNRETLDGGTVALVDGSTTYTACAGDIVFDMTHTTNSTAFNYLYVITDANDNVLGTHDPADGPTIDASGAPAGECHVWGWNFQAADLPAMGDNISTLADDTCEAISSNFITVYREVADGGMITLADGTTEYAGCAGDIIIDAAHTTSSANLGYWYIITDDQDNILAAHNTLDGPTLDLSGAPAGVCHVWGWSSNGATAPVMGENISTLADELCESVSDNFITVYRETPEGGTLDSDLGTAFSICVDDEADPFEVSFTTTAPNLSYWFIITDDQDNILGFQNSADGNVLDLNGAGTGVCRVWGWNYRGLDDPIVGDNISTLSDDFCEDISDNFIEVTRVDEGAPCTVGTDNFGSIQGINIFPNPASNFVQVEYNGLDSRTGLMTLVDINGKTIQRIDLTRQDDMIELNITNLSNGYYIVRIDSENRTSTRKLVVVK